MKKSFAGVLAALLLFTGCGKPAFDPKTLREQYAQRAIQGEYTVTTHAGFYTEYRLSSISDGGGAAVTILEPASVAGVKALLRQGETTIQYEEISIDALTPQVPGFAPMDVLHGIETALREEQPSSFCLENGTVTLDYQQTLADGSETIKQVTLQEETLDFLSAELYLDGDLILVVTMDRSDAAG